jgi:predicted amino acid racemase
LNTRPHTPYLTIDLGKIEDNARVIVRLCAQSGISVTGVTKGVCGYPAIAHAMLRGGVMNIADSRFENIRRLQGAGVTQCMLLRLPALSAVNEVVASTGISLNSEGTVLHALSDAAQALGNVHDVMLMVDLGDLREGIWPDDLIPLARAVKPLGGIRVRGLGTNLACFGGIVPTESTMHQLVDLAEQVEGELGLPLHWISGANSSALELIASGNMPERINHARIGEAILLGRETTQRKPWPGTHQDAFVLHAEVLEKQRKPSAPEGMRSEDAFGTTPRFKDCGDRMRALLNVGREDVMVEGLTPLDPEVHILGASSGYLVTDVTDATPVEVGDELAFSVSYGALLLAMTSEYVEKRVR